MYDMFRPIRAMFAWAARAAIMTAAAAGLFSMTAIFCLCVAWHAENRQWIVLALLACSYAAFIAGIFSKK